MEWDVGNLVSELASEFTRPTFIGEASVRIAEQSIVRLTRRQKKPSLGSGSSRQKRGDTITLNDFEYRLNHIQKD